MKKKTNIKKLCKDKKERTKGKNKHTLKIS